MRCDSSVLSTVLPTISNILDSKLLYVWAVNDYLASQTTVQPMFGQMSNIFGWKWPTFISIAILTLGVGLAGEANNTKMFIAARVVQSLHPAKNGTSSHP